MVDFQPVKLLAMGAAIGFAQTTLVMLKKEDWGKLDFCEYVLILLKQIHILTICFLGYIVITTSILTMLGSLTEAIPHLKSANAESRYALLLLAGYLPSKFLSWLILIKPLQAPLSRVDSAVLKWRELFIEHIKEALKLRLIKLHSDLGTLPKLKENLHPFYQQCKVQIANDLKSPEASRRDLPLMIRLLVEWQGYHETARLLGKTGRFFDLRPILCPLGTMVILAVIIYVLYFFGFFHI